MQIRYRERKHLKLSIVLLCALFIQETSPLFADCAKGWSDEENLEITIESCEPIIARSNAEIQKYAWFDLKNKDFRKMYTGGLIKDKEGIYWMYTSTRADVCNRFVKGDKVTMKATHACCDRGRGAGPCVFGGHWLKDVN